MSSPRENRRASLCLVACLAGALLACGGGEGANPATGGTPGSATGGRAASGDTGGRTETGGASTGGVSGTGGTTAAGGAAGRGGAGGTPGADGGGGGTAGGRAAGGRATGGAAGATAGATQSGGSAGAGGSPGGPAVNRTNPKLYQLQFSASEADPQATKALGKEHAYLDTRVAPKGKLVVFLHGAGEFTDCGDGALPTLVAGWGFHWFGPCYLSNYGVDNCGNDIEGCRLEAFEGSDHSKAVTIARPDSIEERLVRGLKRLQTLNPEGDWQYFLDGNAPRWSSIIISGHSHGASSSGVIGVHRNVDRVVMMAGPYDPGQAWLSLTPMTPRDRFYGFSHTGDSQHSGHLAAFQSLGLPGSVTKVDNAQPPYGNSHRLESSASVSDAHQSVASGNISGFINVWRYLFGGEN